MWRNTSQCLIKQLYLYPSYPVVHFITSVPLNSGSFTLNNLPFHSLVRHGLQNEFSLEVQMGTFNLLSLLCFFLTWKRALET